MIGLDSNIILYLIDEQSKFHDLAIGALEELSETDDFCITHQNINECLRSISHPKSGSLIKRKRAREALLSLTNQLTILCPNPKTIETHLRWLEKYNFAGSSIYDCYLSATFISNYVDKILTNNPKDFNQLSELTILPLVTDKKIEHRQPI